MKQVSCILLIILINYSNAECCGKENSQTSGGHDKIGATKSCINDELNYYIEEFYKTSHLRRDNAGPVDSEFVVDATNRTDFATQCNAYDKFSSGPEIMRSVCPDRVNTDPDVQRIERNYNKTCNQWRKEFQAVLPCFETISKDLKDCRTKAGPIAKGFEGEIPTDLSICKQQEAYFACIDPLLKKCGGEEVKNLYFVATTVSPPARCPGVESPLPPTFNEDACAERQKVQECLQKMTGAARSPNGDQISVGFPIANGAEFLKQCKITGDVWNSCIDEKHLRQSCAKDPLFVQIDGSSGYICREPQRSLLMTKAGCEAQGIPPSCANATGSRGPTDPCKTVQDGVKCMKDSFIKSCGVEYFNILVTVQESVVYPVNRNCKIERASGVPTGPATTGAGCKFTEFPESAVEQRTIFLNDKNVPGVAECAKKCYLHPFCQSSIFNSGECRMSFKKMENCNGDTATSSATSNGKAVALGCLICS